MPDLTGGRRRGENSWRAFIDGAIAVRGDGIAREVSEALST